MLRLEFIFNCASKKQFELAEQVFMLGHKVSIVTNNQEIIELSEDIGIKLLKSFKEVTSKNSSIIVNFDESIDIKNFKNVFILSSSVELKSSIPFQDQPCALNWSYFNDSRLLHIGKSCFAEVNNFDQVMEELYEEFTDYIITLSRDGKVVTCSNSTESSPYGILESSFTDKAAMVSSLYALLASYRKSDNSKLAIASSIYFNSSKPVVCDIKWQDKKSLLSATGKQRIILSKGEITEDSSQAIIDAYIDIDLNQYLITLKCYNENYVNLLNHLSNISSNSSLYLTSEEYKTILCDYNSTDKVFEVKETIDQQFDYISSLYPEKVAVIDQQNEINYKHLNNLSQQLSQYLLENCNITNEKKIAICLPKSYYLVASIFGVLRTGACYVPIDQSYPEKRIINILSETSAEIIICDNNFYNSHKNTLQSLKVILPENLFSQKFIQTPVESKTTATNLAYIIFTSGSTGKPKGVMIEHHSIVNLSQNAALFCKINQNSRILSVASLGFDAFGWDLYGALLSGSTLCLAPDNIQRCTEELVNYIKQQGITIATLTPAVLSLIPRKELLNLETMVVMGDRPNKKLMDEWSENLLLINGYGPTEATIGATLCKYNSTISESCIGTPMHNYQAYVLDQNLCPVPINIAGELCIAGTGLARGYLGDELITKEKFIDINLPHQPNPIRIYRTGDLVRWNHSGMIEFLGRIDRQVKIRGVRIEAGEIETIINTHPAIKESLVMLHGKNSSKKLVVYVTLKDKNQTKKDEIATKLRDYLEEFVHPAALPDSFTVIEYFPINTNGKIDVTALPVPASLVTKDRVEPRTDEEEKIRQIFVEILGDNNVGIFESFIDLGGHSLSATQIGARLNEQFGLNLSTKDIFENTTVASLASLVQITDKSNEEQQIPIQSIRKGPLTNAQERLWYLYQLDPGNVSYNLPLAIKFTGFLDYSILSKSLTYITERHESFRTLFGIEKGVPYQIVTDPEKISLLPKAIDPSTLNAVMTELCQIAFALENKPPIRIELYKINDEEHVLLFIKHNIITDAWSEGVIIKELFQTYQSLQSNGTYPVLLPLQHQIIDIAMHYKNNVNNLMNSPSIIKFWKDKFSGYEEFELPSDYQRPSMLTYKGQRISYDFSRFSWQKISDFAKSQNVTMFMLVLSILKILIYKYTGTGDIVLGTALAGRNKKSFEHVTGFFVNTLPVRTIFSSPMNFSGFLQLIKNNCLDVYKNQDIEFEQIVEQANVVRYLNKNPLFQVMAILQNADEEQLPEIENLQAKKVEVNTKTSMFDMVWNFRESNGKLSVNLDFSTELYQESTILRMVQNYEKILSVILDNCDITIADIEPVSTAEHEFINNHTKGDKVDLGNITIGQWLQESCFVNAEKVAIKTDVAAITYKELDKLAITLSIYLGLTLNNNDNYLVKRVGILMNRSQDFIVAIYGVLRAGYCYVPLDPDYPEERLNYMVEDAGLDAIITEEGLLDMAKSISRRNSHLHLVEIQSVISSSVSNSSRILNPDIELNHDRLAYILYTSGSTGNPKGVMITHGNLINFCQDMIRRLEFKASDLFMSITTISFDIFGLEYLCTLLSGGTLFLCSQDVARNPVSIVNLFNEIQPSKMQATPTMWSMIIDHIFPQKNFSALCGGENFPNLLFDKFRNKNISIWNLYGPTETTIWSTAANLTHSDYVHIGSPIANTECHILDNDLSLVPVGSYGKLFISGAGVAKGYWQKEALTAGQFILCKNTLLYNTGDLVKLNNDGNLLCGGRTDYQVKIRGNRIELGDIEYHLSLHKKIKEVVCHVLTIDNNSVIAAYFIPKLADDNPSEEELRSFLKGKIQAAAMPTAFIALGEFPMTHNKKIDRKKLPVINSIHAYSEIHYIAPANNMETEIQKIWSNVLNIKEISVEANFFSIGGNSLHIPQIVSILNDRFDSSLTIRDFILNSTIRTLVMLIENKITQEA